MSDKVFDYWELRVTVSDLEKRVERLTEALDFIARSSHKTIVESRLHHPEQRGYTDCPCLPCKMAADAIAYRP